MEFKSVYAVLLLMNCFPPYSSFRKDQSYKISHRSIAFNGMYLAETY